MQSARRMMIERCVFLTLFHIGSSFLLVPATAFAESVAIELSKTDLPAVDLVHEGRPLDPDRAVDLRKQGIDLSRLNPKENDVWRERSLSASDEGRHHYPAESSTLQFHSKVLDNPSGWFRSQVVSGDRMFRLSISLNTHQALLRAALLRKIGYPIQSPKWYAKLKIGFQNTSDLQKFKFNISEEAGLVESTRWVIGEEDETNTLVLRDVMLEPASITVPTAFYMGTINSTHLEGQRALRALIIPFALIDVPENVNMYSWEAAQIVSEALILTHPSADAFDETDLDDCRWIMHRIALLTRHDWQEIIEAGRYPSDISAIVLEKTVKRRNDLVAKLGLKDRMAPALLTLPYTTKVTVGSVQEGKVTQEHYPDYALRFTHGDPRSPLRRDDIFRYIKIEGLTTGIKQITARINEDLEVWAMNDLLEEHMEDLQQQFIEHMQKNPTEPFEQPVSTWHGPTGGVMLSASRNIMTGSYYGDQSSDFKVSLVDQISAGAKVGYFMGVDGIPDVIPGVGANVAIQRSYVHVRPIPSIEAADKKKWSEIYVPRFMKNLAGALDGARPDTPPDDVQACVSEGLACFIEELQENEIFTITDTVQLGANASVTVPLASLLGLEPLSYMNTAVFGANANTLILRRTTFTRERGKIKIYLQNIQSEALGVSFDFNWWTNVLRLTRTNKWGQAGTRAFHLDEKPTDQEEIRNTILALKGVLAQNNSEILESRFSPYELDHDTRTRIDQGKFLYHRWANIEESHRVKVRPPRRREREYDPHDFERTLFSHRILKRKGSNYYSFLGDILDGLVQNSSFFRPGLLDGATGSNPKDSFMGNAKWSVTSTEAEVTPGQESNPVTIAEHYWAGWDLSKERLFKVIDQIDARLKSLKLEVPLIDREVFNDMLRLQLYEVRTTFVVYEEGMRRLRERVLAKETVEKGGLLRRLVGWDSYSATDPQFVNELLIPAMGEAKFKAACERIKRDRGHAVRGSRPATVTAQGQTYPCLLPWMVEVLRLRREFPRNSEKRITWTTRVFHLLERNTDIGYLMNWLGKENFFFQVRISGFRTRDENGDTADYTSSTIGTYSAKDRVGVFRDFASDYEIMSSELNANYLSEGY